MEPDINDPLTLRDNRRLLDEVYLRLRSAIATGNLQPGERLIERNLTARLQVSRTPLREALKRLEQDGLVVGYPHRGCFVRQPSFDEAQQAYEARMMAEGMAGALAAARINDIELAAMSRVVQEGRLAVEAGDHERMLLLNNEFHALQARASRNVFLERQLQGLQAYVDLLRGRRWVLSARALETQQEHEQILDALSRRDATAARELNEGHVRVAWKFIESRLREIQEGNGESLVAAG